MTITLYSKRLIYASILVLAVIMCHGTSHAITLNASINPARVNQNVTFTVTVNTSAAAGNINCLIYMDFDQGDGLEQVASINGTTVFTVTRSFSRAGTYTVRVEGAQDCNIIPPTTARMNLVVNDPAPTPSGSIDIMASSREVFVDQAVSFTVPVEIVSGTSCPIYIDYGDGTQVQQIGTVSRDTTLRATHAFSSPGTYEVTAGSSRNCPALADEQATVTIVVQAPSGSIDIRASSREVFVDQAVSFTVPVELVSGTSCPIYIDYDDGTQVQQIGTVSRDTTLSATHAFSSPGIYEVTAGSSRNCPALADEQATVTIVVQAPSGSIDIQASSRQVFVDQAVSFTVPVEIVSGTSCPIYIDYRDGTQIQQIGTVSRDTTLSATHVFSSPGTYEVTAGSSPNCPALADERATVTIVVQAPSGSIDIRANPSRAFVNQTVSFTVPVRIQSTTGCPVMIDYRDGTPAQRLGTVSRDTTLSATHTFTSPGTYNVTVSGTADCPALADEQAVETVDIRHFQVDRIALYFDNGRPEITVDRNDPPPGLYVKINYTGAGLFKGYWEVDGVRRHDVFEHLGSGFEKIFQYPAVPPLPVYTPGTHRVRFIITEPVMQINFPAALYYVTAHEQIQPVSINLTAPADDEMLPFEPIDFKWQTIDEAALYFLRLFSDAKPGSQPVFSAYTNKGSYRLRPEVFKYRLEHGKTYTWDVQGFDDDDRLAAQSDTRSFVIDAAAASVPGQILLVTDPEKGGDGIIRMVQKKYGLDLIQTRQLETLGLNVTQFHTDGDVRALVKEIVLIKGVILVQPNYIFHTLSEPLNKFQTIRKLVDFTAVNTRFTGKGVNVGIVDTGVDTGHPDLENAVSLTQNFVPDSSYRPEIHGTAVAGLIASRINNFGISGCAPDATLFALRACEQTSVSNPAGRCFSLTMALAVDTALENDVNIVNMSLGAPVEDSLLAKLIDEGIKKGVLFVAPAGNFPEADRLFFPASHPGVIAVAGKNDDNSLFPNEKVAQMADICAPSQNVFSTIPGDAHNFLDGTSMASALVTGIMALHVEKKMQENPVSGKDGIRIEKDISDWARLLEIEKKKEK